MRNQSNDMLCYDISDDHTEKSKDNKKATKRPINAKDINGFSIRQLFNKKNACSNEKTSNENFELYNPYSYDICAPLKLDDLCLVPGDNDHACNDEDKFSNPDQDRSQTITASNYF